MINQLLELLELERKGIEVLVHVVPSFDESGPYARNEVAQGGCRIENVRVQKGFVGDLMDAVADLLSSHVGLPFVLTEVSAAELASGSPRSIG